MTTKGYPQHLIDTVVHLYNGTFITIDNATISSRFEVTNQGVKQGCPLSPALFNIYLDAAVNEWQSHLVTHFKLRKWTLNTLMFADDQVIFAKSENDLQFATQLLYNITSEYNLEISSNNSKVMTFESKHPRRAKIVTIILEQVSHFNYLGCDVSYNYDADLRTKFKKFQYYVRNYQTHPHK
jgi:hypothetical protein